MQTLCARAAQEWLACPEGHPLEVVELPESPGRRKVWRLTNDALGYQSGNDFVGMSHFRLHMLALSRHA